MNPPTAVITLTIHLPLGYPDDYPPTVKSWVDAAHYEMDQISVHQDAVHDWAGELTRIEGGDDFTRTPGDAP